MRSLLVHDVGELSTPVGTTPRCGAEQGRVGRLHGVEVYCRDGRIEFIGSSEERERLVGPLADVARFNAAGRAVVPGFVDPHTHLPWAGSREGEFARRLAGATYQQIAAEGGGILATVEATRRATLDELTDNVLRRLDTMLAWGTTTVEAKSGYGLSLEDELKQLRAVRAAGRRHPVRLVPTLLAAHEVPPEHRSDRREYLLEICDRIVPRAAQEGLAAFCDVFCETGFFSVEESRRVLEAGRRHGLMPRLHADEFADSGGAELAADVGAVSADHLMAISERGIAAMARSGVIATLLPGTSFFLLKRRYAPARQLVESGVAVALGTDCNPGSSMTESMPMILWLAVFEMGLSIEEALTAATLNAACSLGLGEDVGSVQVGKRADLVVLDAPSLVHLAYHYGVNPVAAVVKDGVVVHRAA